MTIETLLAPTLDPPDAAAFDRLCAASPFAAYQQSLAWADAARRHPRRDYLRFLCRDGGEAIGAALVRRTRIGPLAWAAAVHRGPVVLDPARFGAVLGGLRDALARQGACALHFAPRVRGRAMPAMLEAMRAHGYAPLPADRQPLHVATGIVWLDKPEDAILAGFKQRARRQLRAAAKAGIAVRPVRGAADIAAYQRVLDAFAAGRPDYDMTGQPDAAGQALLVGRLGGGMLLAERDGEAIGGHAFVRQGDEAIWLSLATAGDDGALPRAYPLLWQAMRDARAMGCVGYDLAGVPLDAPRDAGEANRMQFKAAFAPTRRVMPPMHGATMRPARHLLFEGARTLAGGVRRLRRRAGADARD